RACALEPEQLRGRADLDPPRHPPTVRRSEGQLAAAHALAGREADLPARRRIRLEHVDFAIIEELRAEAEGARAEAGGERRRPDARFDRERPVGKRRGGIGAREAGRVVEDAERVGQGRVGAAEREGAGRRRDAEHGSRGRARVLRRGGRGADGDRGKDERRETGGAWRARAHGRSTKTLRSTVSPATSTARMYAPLATGRPRSVSSGQAVRRSPIS